MADIDEKGDRGISVKSESVAIRTPDAQEARNAAASEIKAFQGLNKNAHNGSAGGDQDLSFELVAFRGDGQAKVVAARQTERLESVSMEELILKGRNGDKFAVSIVQQMRAASDLPEDQRSQAREKLQDTADKMYGRSAGSERISEQLKHVENIDTQTMQALAPSNEVARSALEMRENIEKHVPAGPERDRLITQLKADVTPVLKGQVEQNVSALPDGNEWQAFNRLDQKQQRAVIEAFQTGSDIGQEAYEKQIQAVAESVPKGFYNVGKGLYDSGIKAGTFLIEAAQSPEKVPEAAQKLSESLSTTITSGVKISQVIANYGQETTKRGDYSRPLRDLQTVATIANERWEAIPLEKRTEKASELIADMGIGSIIGAADRLAKSGKMIDALEDLAKYAKDLTASGREKAKHALGSFLDDIFQPKAVTPDGRRIAIPQESRDNYLMSKADDLGDSQHKPSERGSIPEKFLASERFTAELKQALDELQEGELKNLKIHDVLIQPVKRLTDILPGKERLGACYSPEHKAIFVPEEIMRLGKWVSNDDVRFALNHEIGHVFNAKADKFGEYASNFKLFRTTFQKDLQNIPSDVLDTLLLSGRHPEAVRDEILADLYAHAKGLKSNNPYSQLVRKWFPNSLKYVEEMPKW